MMGYTFLTESGGFTDGANTPLTYAEAGEKKPEVIWVASTCLTMLQISVPTRNPSALDQSIPFVVEEQLLGDIEAIHYAWYATPKGQPLPVAIVDKSLMSKWSTAVNQAKLRASRLLPDIFLVPLSDDDTWTVLVLEDRAIVRTSEFHGLSGNHGWITQYLSSQGKKKADTRIILLPGVEAGKVWKSYQPIEGEEARSLLDKQHPYTRSINLLQGNYSVGLGVFRKLHNAHLPIAAACIVALILASTNLLEYFQIQAKKNQLDTLIESQAQEFFSSYTTGDPLRPLVSRHLKQVQEDLIKKQSGSWTILEKAAPLLSKCNNCVYDSISFVDQGFSFKVGSYNPLTQMESIIKQIKNHTVTTKLSQSPKGNNTYYQLNVDIKAGG